MNVELPYYVGRALRMLPQFLAAIYEDFQVKQIKFDPDCEGEQNDPDNGMVEFTDRMGRAIIFFYRYHPGEEGTRGSLEDLTYVHYSEPQRNAREKSRTLIFSVKRHYCGCHHCSIRYFFIPESINSDDFVNSSEQEQLHTIQEFLANKLVAPKSAQHVLI